MASSINASTSGPGGVITTADNSGILNLQSGGNTVATVNSAGMTTVGTVNVPNTFGFKNRLINGNMGIWQRGTSATATTYGYPSVDRWAVNAFGRSTTVSQSSSVPSNVPAQFSAKVQRPNGNSDTTVVIFQQTIESTNCYDLSGQQVTLSFWAKAGANFSGSYLGVQVYTGTVADQGGSTYYAWTGGTAPVSSAPTPTTTWTKYTVTGTFGAGVLEAAVLFFYTPVGTAGADDSFYVTDVQLELGSQATSFDVRSIGTELALCQRYYQALPANGLTCVTGGTNIANGSIYFPVTMRSNPTMSGDTLNRMTNFGFTDYSSTYTFSTNSITTNVSSVKYTGSNPWGSTVGIPVAVNDNGGASKYIYASAEL